MPDVAMVTLIGLVVSSKVLFKKSYWHFGMIEGQKFTFKARAKNEEALSSIVQDILCQLEELNCFLRVFIHA